MWIWFTATFNYFFLLCSFLIINENKIIKMLKIQPLKVISIQKLRKNSGELRNYDGARLAWNDKYKWQIVHVM